MKAFRTLIACGMLAAIMAAPMSAFAETIVKRTAPKQASQKVTLEKTGSGSSYIFCRSSGDSRAGKESEENRLHAEIGR